MTASSKIRALLLALALTIPPATSAQAERSSEAAEGKPADMASDPCLSDSLCRAHFQRGRKLSKEDSFEHALTAYEAAYRRRPTAWLLINIGRTLHKMGRPQEALSYYRRYLSENPKGPSELKEKADHYIREAEDDIRAALPKKTEPPQAGTTPRAEPSGPKPASAADASEASSMPERRRPAPSPDQPTPAAPRPASGMTAERASPQAAFPTAGMRAGLGVGVALALAGIVTGSTALALSHDLQSHPYAGPPGPAQFSKQQQVLGLSATTDVLLPVAGLTLGVTALVMIVRRPKKETGAKRPASLASGAVGPGSAYVMWKGTF